MDGWSFGRQQDALVAKQLVEERRGKPVDQLQIAYEGVQPLALRTYLAIPLETIPAASRSGGELVLGSGLAKVIRRDQSGTGVGTFEQLDDNGGQVTVRVYNPCPTKIIPSSESSGSGTNSATVLVISQETWGDFIVNRVCRFTGSSGSGSAGSGSGSGSQGSAGSGSAGSGSTPCVTSLADTTIDDLPTLPPSLANGSGDLYMAVNVGGCWYKVAARKCSTGGSGSG